MLFGKKKNKEEKSAMVAKNVEKGGSESIEEIESLYKKKWRELDNKEKIIMLTGIGTAYRLGSFGSYTAEVNPDKACYYYEKAAKLGDPEGQYWYGMYQIIKGVETEIDGGGKMIFSIGVENLCKSHLQGYTEATSQIQDLINQNFWDDKNIRTVNDVVSYFIKCGLLK